MACPVRVRVPTASVFALAVTNGLDVADLAGNPCGDRSDAHSTPPFCCSQPAAKLIGPALNGLSQARATFL